ncbi:MAG TPA: methyl-accepting chemotaxis protein [Tissierellaceae bacterium]
MKSNDDSLTNVSDRDFFKEAINGKEGYVSDVILARTTGKLMVVISTPVYDDSHNIKGVLQANLELTKLSEFITELSQDGSTVYVLSRKGTILAHPNQEYVVNQEDFNALEFVKKGLAGESSTTRITNLDGQEVIASYGFNEMTGWLIVVETPVKVAMSSAYKLLNTIVAMFIATIVVITLLSNYFSKSFTKPLAELSSIIKTFANGDLKDFDVKDASSREIDEVYQNLRVMNKNLKDLIGKIQLTASTLASHSLQLSSTTEETTQSLNQVVLTINEMAQGNSDQALMVQETSNAIAKVDSIITEATQKTEVAVDRAKKTLELTKLGQSAIENQNQKIEENNKYIDVVGHSINRLSSMADEIENIIKIISGIAEQTNLLALNASIEAARAGEAGRGFAVVAEEIRKLAEQTGNFTKNIEDIVKEIYERVSEAVKTMKQAREIVQTMELSSTDTKECFSNIFTSVTELVQIVNDLSIALEEVNNQANEVTEQAMSISSVTEEAAASMEEISASSEEQLASMETIEQSSIQLKELAEELLNQVQKFKLD